MLQLENKPKVASEDRKLDLKMEQMNAANGRSRAWRAGSVKNAKRGKKWNDACQDECDGMWNDGMLGFQISKVRWAAKVVLIVSLCQTIWNVTAHRSGDRGDRDLHDALVLLCCLDEGRVLACRVRCHLSWVSV